MLTGRTPHESDFQGMTWGLYQMGKQITAAQYQMCWFQLHAIARQVAHFHETYDVWLTTTFGAPPVRNGTFDFHEKDPVKAFAPIIDYLPVTPMQNATGQPAITLPLHWARERLAGRRAFRRPFRRRGHAVAPCRPARKGETLGRQTSADLELKRKRQWASRNTPTTTAWVWPSSSATRT